MTYEQMLRRAEVFDYSPSRGCIVLRPYGYAMWRIIQEELGKRLRIQAGAEDVYFPTLIPEELIQKEAAHVKGFAPELLNVNIGGKKTGLVLRPTSEAIIYDSFSRWIESYQDLPLAINQWCSVFRAEKRTYPFLRTREFLWQELHAAHFDNQQANKYVMKVLVVYKQFMEEYLALAPVAGKKTESEKFPGAFYTTTLEAMPQKKALQVGTSHNLGTGFAEVYRVQFLNKKGELKHPVITSHGVSWRVLGAMFLSHHDKRGLILPPKIAPVQILIIPVLGKEKSNIALNKAKELAEKLTKLGFRADLDLRKNKRLGFKYTESEIRGIPLMITIGDQELEKHQYSLSRRDLAENNPKRKVSVADDQITDISAILDEIQASLLQKSRAHLNESITAVDSVSDLEDLLAKGGFGAVFLCENPNCEKKLKKIRASARCIPFEGNAEKGKCIYCGKPSVYGKRVLVAKAY